MKGDPEQFASKASMDLLYILIHERMLGGPEADEVRKALEEYCAPFLEWVREGN
jgi:hypothetical protein